MKIKKIDEDFTVCQLEEYSEINLGLPYVFVASTADELSLVCPTFMTPKKTLKREDGWKMFKVEGPLDFSLIGILAKIAQILADKKISIFAQSTYDTDYIMVKADKFDEALTALKDAGYEVE